MSMWICVLHLRVWCVCKLSRNAEGCYLIHCNNLKNKHFLIKYFNNTRRRDNYNNKHLFRNWIYIFCERIFYLNYAHVGFFNLHMSTWEITLSQALLSLSSRDEIREVINFGNKSVGARATRRERSARRETICATEMEGRLGAAQPPPPQRPPRRHLSEGLGGPGSDEGSEPPRNHTLNEPTVSNILDM